jgi:hypothetical protein
VGYAVVMDMLSSESCVCHLYSICGVVQGKQHIFCGVVQREQHSICGVVQKEQQRFCGVLHLWYGAEESCTVFVVCCRGS